MVYEIAEVGLIGGRNDRESSRGLVGRNDRESND